MVGMDQKNFALLSRKLEALNYNDPLDPVSAPLVQKLVDDLVHTTESYRSLKLKGAKQAQESDQWQSKLEVWKKDSERLLHENNQLHVQLIKQAERFDEDKKKHYLETKRVEDQVADLAFWKAQHVDRYMALEDENRQLRERIHDILRTGEKAAKGDFDRREAVSRITVGHPLDPVSSRPSSSVPPSTVGLVQASQMRVRKMEQDLLDASTKAENLKEQLKEAEEKIKKRDLEIERLAVSVEAGRDIDRLNLEYRNEANESVILQLNQQVEFLTGQISQLEDEAKAKRQYEAALEASESGRKDVEAGLRAAVNENAATRKELLELQAELQALKEGQHVETDLAGREAQAAALAVTEIKAQLAAVNAEKEALREELEARGQAVRSAAERGSELDDECRNLQAMLEVARGERDRLRSEAEAARDEAGKVREMLREKGEQLLELDRRAVSLREELDVRASGMRKAAADKEAAEQAASEALKRLADAEAIAGDRAQRLGRAEAELEAREADLRRLQRLLASAEEDADSNSKESSAVRTKMLHLEATIVQLEAEAGRHRRAAEAAEAAAREESEAGTRLQQRLDDAEREATRLKSEGSLMAAEMDLLRERAAGAERQLAVEETKAREAAREKGALERMAPRVDELQAEAAHLSERLVDSEAQVSKLRSEVTEEQGRSRRLEQESEALRGELDEAQAERSALKEQLCGFESKASVLVGDLSKWQLEKQKLMADLDERVQDASRMQEAVAQADARAHEQERRAVLAEQRAAAAGREAAVLRSELEAEGQAASQATGATSAARQREDEARAQAAEALSRAARNQQIADEAQEALHQAQITADAERQRARQASSQLEEARREALEASVELERMKTVFTQLDSMREELVAKLKAKFAEVSASEVRIGSLERELRDAKADVEAAAEDAAKQRSALREREREHDALQAELDAKAERIAALEEDAEEARRQAEEARRALAMAEGHAARSGVASEEASAEAEMLRKQSDTQAQTLRAQQAELDARSQELRAAMDDLACVTREQQVVNSDLLRTAQERDEAREKLRSATAREAQLQQLLKSRESEKEDLLRVYQELGAEARRQASTIAQLEREAAMRETQGSAHREEIVSLQDALHSQGSQNHQYLLDLQAYERQADSLTRQLSRKDEELEALGKDARSLAEQLRASNAVRFELERGREAQGREVSALLSQLEVLKARNADQEMEAQVLVSKLQLESSQVRELEELVARMRAAEHEVYLGEQEAGAKERALEEQKRLLEAQVQTLGKQVAALHEQRDANERELRRLHAGAPGSGSLDSTSDTGRTPASTPAQVRVPGSGAGSLPSLHTRRHIGAASGVGDAGVADADPEGGATLRELRAAEETIARLLEEAAELSSKLEAERARSRRLEEQLAQGSPPAPGQESASLEADNERLMELLSKMDQERTELLRENAELVSSVEGLRTSAVSSAEPDPVVDREHGSTVDELRARLKESEDQRRHLEEDFQKLVESMAEIDAADSATGTTPHRSSH